jgi:uncharacterized protein YkwD
MVDRYNSALWALIFSLAMAVSAGAQTTPPPGKNPDTSSQTSTQPTPKLLSAASASSTEDPAAEGVLLDLANQRRKAAGAPPLRADEGLTVVARAHARLMVDKQQLSHQFEGEPDLMPRLRASGLQLSWVGENVASNASVERAFEALMQSPPHRQNLLDPDFNVAGMAAFWRNGQLYVVQDFARVLPEVVPASNRQK